MAAGTLKNLNVDKQRMVFWRRTGHVCLFLCFFAITCIVLIWVTDTCDTREDAELTFLEALWYYLTFRNHSPEPCKSYTKHKLWSCCKYVYVWLGQTLEQFGQILHSLQEYCKSPAECMKYVYRFILVPAVVIFVMFSAKHLYLLYSGWKKKWKLSEKSGMQCQIPKKGRKRGDISLAHSKTNYWWWGSRQLFLWIVCLSLALSIPWEFVRLYQTEVAKRASVLYEGLPHQCMPQKMTLSQSVKHWLLWQLSWQRDVCEQYHQALLVDPFWEVSPMLVLSSAFSRCISQPIEIFCATIGRSFRLMFAEIPSPWQPVIMLLVSLITIVILLMTCSYRISLPLFFKIEPCHGKSIVIHRTAMNKNRTKQSMTAPSRVSKSQESIECMGDGTLQLDSSTELQDYDSSFNESY